MNKSKKILFIGDPLPSLKLITDSSLALAESALKSGGKVFWCEIQNISYFNNELFIYDLSEINFVDKNDLKHQKTPTEKIPFSFFDFCFVRKDPPFDEEYKNLCWILASQSKVKIINPAESLLSYHEKSLHWRAYSEGILQQENLIPTCFSHHILAIEEFCTQFPHNQEFICKPWLGHGGEDIILFENKNLLLDYLQNGRGTSQSDNKELGHLKKILGPVPLIQPFIEDITTEGDRRVLIARGQVICDFVRLPAEGKIASNTAQGGSAILRTMTPAQNNICEKLAEFLMQKNILFAGLDLIGTQVGEINITSPTGIRLYESLTNINLSDKIFNLLTE